MKKCFVRIRSPDGNGSVWTFHPDHREEILHAPSPRNLSRKRRRPSAPTKLSDEGPSKTDGRPHATTTKASRRHSIAAASIPSPEIPTSISDTDFGQLLSDAGCPEFSDALLSTSPSEIWMPELQTKTFADLDSILSSSPPLGSAAALVGHL